MINFKHRAFLFLSILLLFLSLAFVSFAGQYHAILTKITDGDTVWVIMGGNQIKLRLLGIDTPEEWPSRKMNKDVKACNTTFKNMRELGLAATRHTKTMLFKGEDITVETFGKGYYGRTLAFIILPNKINYNEQEVADGYACVYRYHGHKSNEITQIEFTKLNKLMDQAKSHKRGLWRSHYNIMACLCNR